MYPSQRATGKYPKSPSRCGVLFRPPDGVDASGRSKLPAMSFPNLSNSLFLSPADADRSAVGSGLILSRGGHRSAGGFTLIELLVGFAVLALLVTVLAAAFSNFSQVAATSNRRMEINKQSQALFDRLGFDIASAVKSPGVRMQFLKNTTLPDRAASVNDALIMLTDAKSSDAGGRLANVGYGVDTRSSRSRDMEVETVHRYIQPQRWQDDTTVIDISEGKENAPAIDSQPIAPGILRLELSFVMKDGTIRANPPAPGAPEDVQQQFHDNLGSVIVTVATLDDDSLNRIGQSERDAIRGNLADAVDGESPLASWQNTSFNGMPVVQRGLRFHQRFFRVD